MGIVFGIFTIRYIIAPKNKPCYSSFGLLAAYTFYILIWLTVFSAITIFTPEAAQQNISDAAVAISGSLGGIVQQFFNSWWPVGVAFSLLPLIGLVGVLNTQEARACSFLIDRIASEPELESIWLAELEKTPLLLEESKTNNTGPLSHEQIIEKVKYIHGRLKDYKSRNSRFARNFRAPQTQEALRDVKTQIVLASEMTTACNPILRSQNIPQEINKKLDRVLGMTWHDIYKTLIQISLSVALESHLTWRGRKNCIRKLGFDVPSDRAPTLFKITLFSLIAFVIVISPFLIQSIPNHIHKGLSILTGEQATLGLKISVILHITITTCFWRIPTPAPSPVEPNRVATKYHGAFNNLLTAGLALCLATLVHIAIELFKSQKTLQQSNWNYPIPLTLASGAIFLGMVIPIAWILANRCQVQTCVTPAFRSDHNSQWAYWFHSARFVDMLIMSSTLLVAYFAALYTTRVLDRHGYAVFADTRLVPQSDPQTWAIPLSVGLCGVFLGYFLPTWYRSCPPPQLFYTPNRPTT
ncbi:MAG: hypothetical protein AAGC44_06745 [Planctomycetota bacterium]